MCQSIARLMACSFLPFDDVRPDFALDIRDSRHELRLLNHIER